nr:MAG TPA: hypothetical protein [Bacteriophage sp.]
MMLDRNLMKLKLLEIILRALIYIILLCTIQIIMELT